MSNMRVYFQVSVEVDKTTSLVGLESGIVQAIENGLEINGEQHYFNGVTCTVEDSEEA